MYNKSILMGRICNDLELKTTPAGVNVLSFRLAVDRSYQAKGEERKSDFFNIVAWRTNAEFIQRYFTKGRMILVEGELQTRQYKNKEGVEVTITELVADKANFTGEPKTNGNGTTSNATPQTATYTTAPQNVAQGANSVANTSGSDYVDDDYPYPF